MEKYFRNSYLSISLFYDGHEERERERERERTKRAETAIAFFCHTWKLTKPLTKGEERHESFMRRSIVNLWPR